MYGCGSTQCGQLPYLKFSSADGSEASAGEQSGDEEVFRPARNEVTKPTRLKLPFLQVVPLAVRLLSDLSHMKRGMHLGFLRFWAYC